MNRRFISNPSGEDVSPACLVLVDQDDHPLESSFLVLIKSKV